jgi:hypothetical protein
VAYLPFKISTAGIQSAATQGANIRLVSEQSIIHYKPSIVDIDDDEYFIFLECQRRLSEMVVEIKATLLDIYHITSTWANAPSSWNLHHSPFQDSMTNF